MLDLVFISRLVEQLLAVEKDAYRNIGIKVYILTATLSFFDNKSKRGI